jgi:hypothetical protein
MCLEPHPSSLSLLLQHGATMVMAQPFKILQTHFVAILKQYNKRIKENERKLIPALAVIVQPISY